VPVALIRLPGRPAVPLEAGGTLSFGRSAPQPLADLVVSDSARISRRAGILEATPYGVLLTNTGSNPLLVEEGAGRQTLRPGGTHLLAAGRARVEFPGTDETFELELAIGEPARDRQVPPDERTADRTRPAWSLAENTAYFACLVALCEPTLLHPESPWIPTSQQIADRLWDCGLLPEPRTADWVDRRLDDVREKLPIGERAWSAHRARLATPEEQQQAIARELSGAPRRSGRKEQLVEFALTYGIVTAATVRRVLGPGR
jgi:hypothetical protein